jgi:hypothetical protein
MPIGSTAMPTQEQTKDAERLARYIEREQLVSVMNDTKWRRLFDALEPLQGLLEFRRKDVRGTEPKSESWCGDLYHMLDGWSDIEWLEIRGQGRVRRGALLEPIIEDKTHLVIESIRRAGVRFSQEGNRVRIWGYLRPGGSPRWEE